MVTTITKMPTISQLQKTIILKPFNNQDYYSTSQGQTQAAAQIQQSRNIVSVFGGMTSQSTLPQSVLTKTIRDVSGAKLNTESPLIIPVPPAQVKQETKSSSKKITVNSSDTYNKNIDLPKDVKDVVTSANVNPQYVETPSALDILKTQIQAGVQDIGTSAESALGEMFKYGLIALAVFAFASNIN